MMTRFAVTAALVSLALVLQSTIAPILGWEQMRPWFPGMVLVASVFLNQGTAGILWAALLGLGIDSLSSERVGVQLAIATVIASLLAAALEETPSRGTMIYSIFVIVSTFLWRSLNVLTQAWLVGELVDPMRVLILASGDASYTTAIVLFLTTAYRLVRRVIHRQESRSTFSLNNQWSMLTRFER